MGIGGFGGSSFSGLFKGPPMSKPHPQNTRAHEENRKVSIQSCNIFYPVSGTELVMLGLDKPLIQTEQCEAKKCQCSGKSRGTCPECTQGQVRCIWAKLGRNRTWLTSQGPGIHKTTHLREDTDEGENKLHLRRSFCFTTLHSGCSSTTASPPRTASLEKPTGLGQVKSKRVKIIQNESNRVKTSPKNESFFAHVHPPPRKQYQVTRNCGKVLRPGPCQEHCPLARPGRLRKSTLCLVQQLCWVRAASGPSFGEQFISTESGFKMGFCQWAGMGQKWVKSGFLGAKVGQLASKPTFAPTLNPFRDFHENPLFTQFKGGGNCFLKTALRQSRPSIMQQNNRLQISEISAVVSLRWHKSARDPEIGRRKSLIRKL